MACAHAKFTGEVGVCLATSGPGAIHCSTASTTRKMDHQPVVAIVGQRRAPRSAATTSRRSTVSLFKDVAHEYVQQCMVPAQARHLIDRAMRIAFAERTRHLRDPAERRPGEGRRRDAAARARHDVHRHRLHRGALVPSDDDLSAAADDPQRRRARRRSSSAPARSAPRDEVIAVADRLGAGVAKALLGKAVVPDDLPFVTGAIGLLGSKASDEMMQDCDTLFMIGSSFPYVEFLPEGGQGARRCRSTSTPRKLSLRYPMDVALHGDARHTLRALLPLLAAQDGPRVAREDRGVDVATGGRCSRTRAYDRRRADQPAARVLGAVAAAARRRILTADSGSTADWCARDLKMRDGMMASLSGNLATMGPAVPYAVGGEVRVPRPAGDRAASATARCR